MRKLVLAAVLALTASVVTPLVSSQAAPARDQATGSGTLGQFGNPTASVNAVQTTAGLKGSFTITYPDGTSVTGNVTCLFVSGTTAYVTGRITDASGPRAAALNWQPGNFLVIGVRDNGPGSSGTPDQLNFSPGFSTDPGCGPNPAASPDFSIVAGNYNVVDG